MKTASFVGGQLFWDMFLAYRVCWIMGRYGAGKTSLSVLMGAKLLVEKRVKQVVSNIPLSFSSPIDDSSTEKIFLENSGILLDESWIYLDSRSSVLEYAGFVRKFNHYLLLPSVFPVHPRLSFFYVQRIFNGYTLGLPIWVYRWTINNKGIKESGIFGVSNPTAVFGHYPTDYVAGDDGNISKAVTITAITSGYKGTRTEQKRKNKKTDNNFEDDDGLLETAQALEDTAYTMDETKEEIRKAARVLQKVRR